MDGEYLRDDYLRTLEKTRSPLKSSIWDAPILVIVKRDASA